jgi:predicted O-methyltransferase YrrM
MSPHRAELVRLVREHGWMKGAELGVDKGILTRMLLEGVSDLHLTCVDIFPLPERKEKVYAMALPFADRCRLLSMTTREASAMVADHSLDFVFIDADHSDSAVTDDIACWQSKVKQGGWLGGHDYHPRKFPGVVSAVDRAFGRNSVRVWPGTIWGLWL